MWLKESCRGLRLSESACPGFKEPGGEVEWIRVSGWTESAWLKEAGGEVEGIRVAGLTERG